MTHRCATCDKDRRKKCDKQPAKAYKSFKNQRSKELDVRFLCEEVRGRCKLDKCAKYKQCRRPVKEKWEEWQKAYSKNCKTDRERLSKGGV